MTTVTPAAASPQPASPPATSPPKSARDRLLSAADELFYEEGIHTVGIDRVIEQAGVAKATLYSLFGSKDGLIREYLQVRLVRRQTRTRAALESVETPKERLLTVFDVLGSFIAEPGYHGCAFMNAAAESKPGSAAAEAANESRAWTRSLFTELTRDVGAADPDRLARQLIQLYDGALVSARMDSDPDAAVTARASAAALIDAATA